MRCPGRPRERILAADNRLSWAATRSTERRGWVLLVEQVASDQYEIDLLGEGQVDGRDESGELPFALGARLLAEVVMARAEMDVSGVDDP